MGRGKRVVLDDQGRKRCPKCDTWKELEKFPRSKGNAFDRHSWCHACHNNLASIRYNPDYFRNQCLIRNYGITSQQYGEMLKAQNGVCASCGCPERQRPGRTRRTNGTPMLHVDHDHKTGAIRGLLCNACNTALGSLDESPRKIKALLQYLEDHSIDEGIA